MSENAPQTDSNDYLEQHPSAVPDVDKARFMAEMMNPHETKAAQLRQNLAESALAAATATDSYHHGKPLVEMGVQARSGDLTRDINTELNMSDRKANDAANIYEAIQSTKR